MGDRGAVSVWSGDDGWGVIDASVTPGGCWVGFSDLAAGSFWEPRAGEDVEFDWERVEQDGYQFRATRVWPFGSSPTEAAPAEPPGPAYRSHLSIEFD